ncbi:MAG TPA: 16S rRNA (adenine(1518)-N(6)/adenine(1519)-N(6))-dimethyltransferase RsmA [Bacteroidia bacterium]|nr:16S rRNA (adenine(1518)-N(6)/adenine(1519)-N(6))-dimethyltransferase RsmA [Bacteroidia bacterium]
MKHPVRAKKHLGQHFLNDEGIAKRIVEALIEKEKTLPILEIGPGTGVLTKYLIAEKLNFIAWDVDEESIAHLKEKYPELKDRFELRDFLENDLGAQIKGPYCIIGNFPYNISSQIMFKVLEHRNAVPYVVGMFQKEVAQRLAEKPGTKTYGILSVLLQAYYDIEYLFTVHENVFTPPPKVKSAVIRLTRNKREKLDCDEVLFKKIIKATFNQRRKTIRNSIKAVSGNLVLQHPLLEKRPEQLSVEEFIDLTKTLEKICKLD